MTYGDPDGTAPVLRRRDGTPRHDELVIIPPATYPRDVTGHAIPQERVYLPGPRRSRNTNRAQAVRNGARALWWQMTRVAPWYAGAAVLAWFLTARLTGSVVWAWVAAAVPTVIFLVWIRLVMGQARDHYRGDASAPPGAYGRF